MLKPQQFEKIHNKSWKKFEELLTSLESRKLDAKGIRKFPQQYRTVCQQLSLARERRYSRALSDYLAQLATRGHQQLYASENRIHRRIIAYLTSDFPALIRKEWRYVSLASALFYLPFLAMLFIIWQYPHVSYMLFSPEQLAEFEEMYDPAAEHFGTPREVDSEVMMWAHYVNNNVSIGFRCFAGGFLAGIGSIFYMMFNGIFIGGIAGHLTAVGYTETFWSFVSGHSALELTGIVLSGAAGLRLGHGFIAPGRKKRLDAIRDSAAEGVRILYGASFMIFLAAFIEAFWSSQVSITPMTKYIFGIAMWALTLGYFIFAGRSYGTR